jgi:RNA polymerase sigma-70 factor, ECF subfamily
MHGTNIQQETSLDKSTRSCQQPSWPDLVHRIKEGHPGAMEELYRVLGGGIRAYLCRAAGSQDLDDRVHDILVIVVSAIRRGEIREPERLMGFVMTIVRRHVAGQISQHTTVRIGPIEKEDWLRDSEKNPEEKAIWQEKMKIMRQVLRELSVRDREVLNRFYLLEQTQEQVCQEMELSATQFRLLKSRARSRFGGLGKRSLVVRAVVPFRLRTIWHELH